jgi:hypothetical protein
MGKPTTYLNDEDDVEYFNSDDLDSSERAAEHEPRRREPKPQNRHAARQRLDSRKEELWLKQQLNDWDDGFEDSNLAD